MIHHIQSNIFPLPPSPWCLLHVVNDIGGWGRGFVCSLTANLPSVEYDYRRWVQRKLGLILISRIGVNAVVHLCAQRGIRSASNPTPIRYQSLTECLEKFNTWYGEECSNASIIMPRIGCGLAGGKWNEVEGIITTTLPERDVFVYSI